jgi:hypothetical protein
MSGDIDDETTITVPSEVVSRQTAGETVLMSLESERYYALEGAAGRLWELVSAEDASTVGAVIARMQAEFDVDPAVLAEDVHRMVRELETKGLLTIA